MIISNARPLSELPQRRFYVDKRDVNNDSYFYRDPRYFAQLRSHIRNKIRSGTFREPYFVLSAGFGTGKEPVSAVMDHLLVLKEMRLSIADFPIVVVAVDFWQENLEILKRGRFDLNYGNHEEKNLEGREEFFLAHFRGRVIQVHKSVLRHIYPSRIDLRISDDLLSLQEFTPDQRGFHAIFFHGVHYSTDPIWSDRKSSVIEDLGFLLRTDVTAANFFYCYGGGGTED